MRKSIVWLASYPKSGNTWTRIFLANYFSNQANPLPINEIDKFGFGDSGTQIYQRVAGNQAVDLTDRKVVLTLRNKLMNAINGNGASVNFVKTHNADTQVYGLDLSHPQITRSAIYFIRNPLDVVVSMSRHFGMTHAETAEWMGRSDYMLNKDGEQVRQYLGSWSDHVSSWSNEVRFPVLVVRYEDMLADPTRVFEGILRHMGAPIDPARLQKAVKFSSFDEVSKQEQETGFGEVSEFSDRFFASGTSDQWKADLAPEVVKKIRKQHRKLMKKYGYSE